MKAKDKAIELVKRFYVCKISTNRFRNEEAKQCALICVDEILDAVTTIADKKFEFYKEVKI